VRGAAVADRPDPRRTELAVLLALTPAQLAHQARRLGYHAPDRHTAYVHCPQCRGEVYADPARVAGRSGDDRSVFPALDAAMLAHLPHCTNGA
jgi:hypothetical protein